MLFSPRLVVLAVATGASFFGMSSGVDASNLIISGVIDGPLSGGVPKAVELYALATIADLSVYGVGFANNGGGTDGEEFTFPAVSLPAGSKITVASESEGFTTYFGFAPDYVSGSAAINGDDAIELFENDVVVDIYGDINVDGNGQPWEYLDGWAYRNAGATPTTTFDINDWTLSGANALDPCTTTTNAQCASVFPINTFGAPVVPTPSPISAPPPIELIEDIQGSDAESPLKGSAVSVKSALVTSVFSNGFTMEQPGADPSRSSGIFVFTGSAPSVAFGDIVSLTGDIDEFFSETQLENVSDLVVESSNNPVNPTVLSLPTTQDLEAYEGMYVSITTDASSIFVVSEYFNLDRFGEFVACAAPVDDGRVFQFTQRNAPDMTGYQEFQDLLSRSCITVDDGNGSQNPDPILVGGLYEFPSQESIRGGQEVTVLTGSIRFSFSKYRIIPSSAMDLEFAEDSSRQDALDKVNNLDSVDKDDVRVVSTNVLNFFTSLDIVSCSQSNYRGADSEEEFLRQQTKIVSALKLLDADIYGVVEIENTITNAATFQLVRELNSPEITAIVRRKLSSDRYYSAVSIEASLSKIGSDAIKVDIVFDTETLELEGSAILTDDLVDPAILAQSPDCDPDCVLFDGRSRVPLAATFKVKETGTKITVVVNHFKSKGSSGGGDPDQGDGAGNWNVLRTLCSEALLAWLATNPTGVETDNILILGDLNAYAQEPPITTLTSNGFIDLENAFSGNEPYYGYVFDGQWGTLDYILGTVSTESALQDIFSWNINADEPDALDYNLDFGRNPSLFDGSSPIRFSDHDPIVALFDTKAMKGSKRGRRHMRDAGATKHGRRGRRMV